MLRLRPILQLARFHTPHRTLASKSEAEKKQEYARKLRVKSTSSRSSALYSLKPPTPRTRQQLRGRFCTGPYEQPGEPRPQYPKRKSPFKRAQAIIDALNDEESVKRIKEGRAVFPKKVPKLRSGDIVRVGYCTSLMTKKIQYFTGVCIAVRKRGLGSTFILRNVIDGVPTERGFPTYSPLIKDAEVVGRRNVRRNKLYYLRDKPLRESTFPDALKGPS